MCLRSGSPGWVCQEEFYRLIPVLGAKLFKSRHLYARLWPCPNMDILPALLSIAPPCYTTSKMIHYYSSPNPSPPANPSYFLLTNESDPYMLLFPLKSILGLCCIPYPMTPRFMEDLQAPSQHFKKLGPHCLGSGSFYTETDGCLGHVGCMPCALLALHETGLPVFCWQFKAGKVAGTVNKPQGPNNFPSLNNLTKWW